MLNSYYCLLHANIQYSFVCTEQPNKKERCSRKRNDTDLRNYYYYVSGVAVAAGVCKCSKSNLSQQIASGRGCIPQCVAIEPGLLNDNTTQ